MATRKRVREDSVYQMKITLRHSKPPIWRRVLVRADATLGDLHDVIQLAMGWHNCHLHSFTVDGLRYGMSMDDLFGVDCEELDEQDHTLRKLLPAEKARLTYDYDFGDGWGHIVTVEKIIPVDPAVTYPICSAGARACPPEDCGGMFGFYDMIEALSDPKHPSHEDLSEWIGDEGFDEKQFDLDEINGQLDFLRPSTRKVARARKRVKTKAR